MRPRFTGLWRHPDFLKLWLGQTISEIGSRITREGLPLTAVIVLGATPLPMGILASLSGISTLVFGPIAGLWVDRHRRRPILIAADLGRAVVLASVPLAAAFRALHMRQLYIVAALAGVLTVFFDVAYQSYLPSLVERHGVLEGNSKLALSTHDWRVRLSELQLVAGLLTHPQVARVPNRSRRDLRDQCRRGSKRGSTLTFSKEPQTQRRVRRYNGSRFLTAHAVPVMLRLNSSTGELHGARGCQKQIPSGDPSEGAGEDSPQGG